MLPQDVGAAVFWPMANATRSNRMLRLTIGLPWDRASPNLGFARGRRSYCAAAFLTDSGVQHLSAHIGGSGFEACRTPGDE